MNLMLLPLPEQDYLHVDQFPNTTNFPEVAILGDVQDITKILINLHVWQSGRSPEVVKLII